MEFASDTASPYLKPRVEIGRKLGSNGHEVTPFALWETAYRTDGKDMDVFRFRAGLRIPLRSGFEIVPMYDRRGGRNGATLLVLYEITRAHRCGPDLSSQQGKVRDK